MKITVKENELIRDIQESFGAYFPFLKLEFFRKAHTKKALSSHEDKLPPSMSLENLLTRKNIRPLEINEQMTTRELEQLFETEWGLFVRVFRKSGRVWIQTSHTDHWTLAQQNDQGKIMSNLPDPASETEMLWNN